MAKGAHHSYSILFRGRVYNTDHVATCSFIYFHFVVLRAATNKKKKEEAHTSSTMTSSIEHLLECPGVYCRDPVNVMSKINKIRQDGPGRLQVS